MSLNVRAELDVRGIPEVVAWFEGEFSAAAKNSAFEATDEVLDEAVDDAKRGAPVDTGSHQKSIRKERLAKPRHHYTYQGIRAGGYITNPKTGRKVDYSRYLEYGTSRMRPRPHIRPAIRKAIKKLPRRFLEILSRRIDLE